MTLDRFHAGNQAAFCGHDGTRLNDDEPPQLFHRFDVVEDVHLGEREVSYRDLLLDIWIDASGVVQVEDESDVADARREGTLSNVQLDRINGTRDLILRRHRVIAAGAERLLP